MSAKVLAVEAYSFESRFVLKELPAWLPDGLSARTSKTLITCDVGEDGTLFAFDFGSLVFVNVPRAEVEAILKRFGQRLPREPHAPLREDFSIRIDPTRETPGVTFDAIELASLTPLGLEAIATVLAQSVTIDYYDEDLQATLKRVGAIAQEIARRGRPGGRSRDLVRFVGSAIAAQVEIVSSISLLDKPDFTWEDEHAERLYDLLRHHLEIQERFRALESKLVTIRESLTQFLEMISTRRALWLESAVVFLILFEIVMGLYELMHR